MVLEPRSKKTAPMSQLHDFRSRALPTVILLGFSCAIAAEEQCDCTSIVDSCRADVALIGDRVEIASDNQQCSRVDYFIDGQPFVALVLGGEHSSELAARRADPAVLVQSCQVCRSIPISTELSAGALLEDDGVLRPLIQVTPVYPEDARSQGVEGYVELELTVTPAGTVSLAAITAAEPAGVFDLVTLAAADRWRYPADLEREPRTVSARVEFRLDEAESRPAAPRGVERSSAYSGGPRNQCLRQGAAYNYGDVIDIELVNACEEPLLVYGCAPGAGRHAGRWVCFDSEQRRSLLVRPRDARVGSAAGVDTVDGSQAFDYTDSFLVTRAPNSQYLWVACPAADTACRGPARQWVQSVNRQPDQVDPRHRTYLPLARSH
jgi:TonB family protein